MTKENIQDLERIQKAAVSIILNKSSNNYEDALEKINLQTLEKRREDLCLKFAKKCTGNNRMKEMFPKRKKNHCMDTRNEEEYVVKFAHTERLKKSAIPYMQNLLNEECKTKVK